MRQGAHHSIQNSDRLEVAASHGSKVMGTAAPCLQAQTLGNYFILKQITALSF